MTHEYQIVKANAQPGVDGIANLETQVTALTREGWEALGAPFYDSALMRWCQAVQRVPHREPEMFREPAPAPPRVDQQPDLRVHSDPKDRPLQHRKQVKPAE